jgi:hypothetical protein
MTTNEGIDDDEAGGEQYVNIGSNTSNISENRFSELSISGADFEQILDRYVACMHTRAHACMRARTHSFVQALAAKDW